MTAFCTTLPPHNSQTRQAIYEGALFLLPATSASRALVERANFEIDAVLGACGPAREAQFRMSAEEFFAKVGRLRRGFYTSSEYHREVGRLIAALGFAPGEQAFDPIRLRVVSHAGHLNPDALPMYYGHRDTWYSNPQQMITWWIPLHDVSAQETFEFFPEEFCRPLQNDSEIFDFDRWVERGQDQRIGWQDRATGRTAGYPRLQESPRGERLGVDCRAGDILLFSAQHLHQTRPNTTGLTRFSLDFRTVQLADHAAGRGPGNVDNRSTGNSLAQFIRPAQWTPPAAVSGSPPGAVDA